MILRRLNGGPLRRISVVALALACSVLALLLWGKLKLVAGVPRTAYAEPEPGVPRRMPRSRPVPGHRAATAPARAAEGPVLGD